MVFQHCRYDCNGRFKISSILALNNGPNFVKALRSFTAYASIALNDVQNLDGRLFEHVFDYHTNTDTNPTANDILQSQLSMDYSQLFRE